MTRNRVIAVLGTALLLHAAGLGAAPQQAPVAPSIATALPLWPAGPDPGATALDDLDEVVVAAMREWSVPGLALAVTVDGEVVVSKGYGERHREGGLPATPRTLFPIASLSKAFTATVLASLVEDGLLTWDRPVIEYMPDFRLSDDERTRSVTPRDLVTHQSGLPRHDFVWYGADLSPRELYERLRYLAPSAPLRQGWQYQNLMFLAAGMLAEHVTGSSWETLVRERVFAPLHMDRSTTSLAQLKQSANIAFPYAEGRRGPRRVSFRSMDAVAPAGSISSSAEELTRFLQLLLGDGTFAGTRVVSGAVVRELTTPQVELPPQAIDPAMGPSSYGMGLVLSHYAGHRLAHHEGGVDGFVSLMSFLPDDGIGVVVLTNYSGDNPVPWIVTRSIYDRLLHQTPRDWLAYARAVDSPHVTPAASGRAVAAAAWRRGPSRPLPADYAGSYWHPAYGQVDIVLDEGDLVMRFHGIDARITRVDNRRYQVAQGSLAGLHLTFLSNAVNRFDRVAIPWEPEVDDIVFVRRSTADGHEDDGG